MRIPRLLIAGTHSGVGKTTVTIGLIQGLMQRGLRVQPFKLGPDYIDPGYHTKVAGRTSRNLDTWMIPPAGLIPLFQRTCQGVDVALIEGVMGLYDGIGATGEQASTAELAKLLRCPVLLVLDASALSRSAAAIVRGYVDFDPHVQIVGCLLNRMAGPGHYRLVKEGIERLARIPVVGFLPKDDRCVLPERHLGLIPSNEERGWQRICAPLLARIREGVDLAAVERMARRAQPFDSAVRPELVEGERRAQGERTEAISIGVAMDEAFHFYYPENMELLEEFGAELVPFSPLRDSQLPSGVGALYLGGGFPEVYASELARNRRLHREIRRAVSAGIPTYAECGGLMVLARSIADTKGHRHPMVGLVPGEIQMTDRLQHFGYKQLRARRPSLLARVGESAKGHEFHHSVCTGIPTKSTAAYEATSVAGGGGRLEGYAHGNLLASYIHLHFLSRPRWAERFVQAARNWEIGMLLTKRK